jgi:pimeloyl-ACP methyl ester carboxylesterase
MNAPNCRAFTKLTVRGIDEARSYAGDHPADQLTEAAWKSRPSWFIVSARDRMIDPRLQRAMAARIGARTTELPASHVPQQSRPADVAKVILEAVAATR